MKPVKQIFQGGPSSPPEEQGDCFRACICSLLELPIDGLPNPPPGQPFEDWERQWLGLLAPLGYWMTGLNVEDWDEAKDGERFWISPGYWIASVPSRNVRMPDGKPVSHAVVMKGRRIAHDPQTKNPYKRVTINRVLGARWLIPIDPGAMR